MIGKSLTFLKEVFLVDEHGATAKIIKVRALEAGLDHVEITTQSAWEREQGVASIHRVYSEEVALPYNDE